MTTLRKCQQTHQSETSPTGKKRERWQRQQETSFLWNKAQTTHGGRSQQPHHETLSRGPNSKTMQPPLASRLWEPLGMQNPAPVMALTWVKCLVRQVKSLKETSTQLKIRHNSQILSFESKDTIYMLARGKKKKKKVIPELSRHFEGIQSSRKV